VSDRSSDRIVAIPALYLTTAAEFQRTGYDPLGQGGMMHRRFEGPLVSFTSVKKFIIGVEGYG
jgi:hypothetical protein